MRHLLPPAAAAAAPLAVVVALTWPLSLHLGDWHMVTAWGDSHVWIMDWTARRLAEGDLLQQTAEAGYPTPRDLRALGGLALLLHVGLSTWLTPLAAGTLAHLLVFCVTGLCTYAALGRVTAAEPWVRAAVASAFALGPTVLSTLGMGEISNTQAWVLPAFVWVADRALPLRAQAPASPRHAPLALLVGLLGGLSSPYYTLSLPLVGGAWVFAAVLRRRAAALLPGGLLLLSLALGMLPVGAYYGGGAAGGVDSLVNPAPRAQLDTPRGDPLPDPPPVATPERLLLGTPPRALSPYQADHVAYLGLPLLFAAALAAARRPAPGRALGLALLVGGVTMALGPWLAVGARYALVLDRALLLPAWVLEQVGYPTRQGGLYFRYAVLAELGLCVLLAAGLAGRRHAVAIAWGLALVHAADSVRDTMPRWPLRVQPVADKDVLEAMAPPQGSVMEADGAVLELPLQGPTDGLFGQAAVLRALFHRRPTTGILRDVRLHEHTARAVLERARRQPERFAATLSEAGFRFVLLPRELAAHSVPDEATLRRLLGDPWHDGDLVVWDLGPTELVLVEGR